MDQKEINLAFIDGQNLYMGINTSSPVWRLNLIKFRNYLSQKYKVENAYYFLGYLSENNHDLYNKIQEAGFILVFKQHSPSMMGKKKGNVDSDIIFNIMKRLYKKDVLNKIIIVSGDGDYKALVDFLIAEGKFDKILFPNKKFASSLYKKMPSKYYDYLENEEVKKKIRD